MTGRFQAHPTPARIHLTGGNGGSKGSGSGKKVSDEARAKVLNKCRFLRNEDRKLQKALQEKNLGRATELFSRLAKLRNHLKVQSALAKDGKTFSQRAGRAYAAIYGLGIPELVRAIRKKRKGSNPIIEARRQKKAEKLAEKAACTDVLLQYWRARFRALVRQIRNSIKQQNRTTPKNLATALTTFDTQEATFDSQVNFAQPVSSVPEESLEVVADAAISEEGLDRPEPTDVQDITEADVSFGPLSGTEFLGFSALGFLAGLLL